MGFLVHDAARIGRSVVHDAARIGRSVVHDAASVGRSVVHDARTGNTASEVVVVKEVCGAVYGGPYLFTDVLGSSAPS